MGLDGHDLTLLKEGEQVPYPPVCNTFVSPFDWRLIIIH